MLYRQRVFPVFESQSFCNLSLVIEQQAILGTSCQQMQGKTYPPQKALPADQVTMLRFTDDTVLDQAVQGLGTVISLRHPGDHLDVTEATRAFFDVRFQVVGCFVVTGMPLLLFFELGSEKLLAGPHFPDRCNFKHFIEQWFGTGQQAGLHHGGDDDDVFLRSLEAILNCADTVAQVETRIPEYLHKRLDFALWQGITNAVTQQDQQIHV